MVAGPRTYLPSETGRHPASIHPDILMLNDRTQISKTSPTKQPPSANFTHRDVLANPILALSENVQMAAEIDLLLLCPSEILALKHARVGFSDSGLTLYLVQGRANPVLYWPNSTESNLFHHGESTYMVK